MRTRNFSGKPIDHIMSEIYKDLELLYALPCAYTRSLVLDHMRDRIFMIESVVKAMEQSAQQARYTMPYQTASAPAPQGDTGNTTTFTPQELARFDGKNGNPAYVAVNNTVYDVTNHAAWAAATHFGLAAGRDLTSEFASCHGGQPILSKLRVVGKLV